MLMDDQLHLAPLNEEAPLRILDVGTGTGIWAMDVADKYPNAEVYGNDLSPIQPRWYANTNRHPRVMHRANKCI